jgi:hypothetical protein
MVEERVSAGAKHHSLLLQQTPQQWLALLFIYIAMPGKQFSQRTK